MYRTSHQLWVKTESGAWRRDISGRSEIFALGCVLYSIETCDKMFVVEGQKIEKDEIVRRLQDRQFPSLDDTSEHGNVIEGCWWQRYESMKILLADLDEQEDTTCVPSVEEYDRLGQAAINGKL